MEIRRKKTAMPDYQQILTAEKKVEIAYEPIPIAPVFAYDNVVKDFYDFIKLKDIKRILPSGFKAEYIDSVLTFKKRYIRIRQLQDAVELPCLICKSSLAPDKADRMFMNDVFNCDISGDTIASRIHPRKFADTLIDTEKVYFGVTPRNAALNVEISVLDDSEQKMDNLLLMWDRIRYQEMAFDVPITVRNILPTNQVILLCYHLGYFKDRDISKIDSMNYIDMYKFLSLHITPDCPYYLIYEKDTSTSLNEIVMCVDVIVEVEPEILNKSNDRDANTSHDRTLITRPFSLYFNTVSFMYIWLEKSEIDGILDELALKVDRADRIEVAKNLIETNFGDILDYNSEPIPQYIDNCSLYYSADYEIATLEELKDIDCSQLIDIRAQAYIERMQELYPVARWKEFYDVRIDNKDELVIDYKTLHISITPVNLKIRDIVKIAIYINKSEMDYFLNSST